MDMQQRYESAAAFYRACSKKCVLNERPEIHFIKDSANFWYCADVWQREQEGERKASKEYILYDFACNQKVPLFDRKKLMSALEPYLPQPLDEEQELPLEISALRERIISTLPFEIGWENFAMTLKQTA